MKEVKRKAGEVRTYYSYTRYLYCTSEACASSSFFSFLVWKYVP